MSRAIFLDKDDTLVENVPYNVDPARIRLAPGATEALSGLQAAGFDLYVVTNQAGVAHGYFPEEALQAVESRLCELLAGAGLTLAGFFYCPHNPGGCVERYAVPCDCRKPQPGMLLAAARAHHIHLGDSWLVGDIVSDVEAGNRAGCRSILIDHGVDSYDWDAALPDQIPFAICHSLTEAARTILTNLHQSPVASSRKAWETNA